MVNTEQGGIINGHEWIDLGLSVKWATCNIGASSPGEPGDYFAWGETEPKSEYSWENYKFWVSGKYMKATFNKYCSGHEQNQEKLVQTSKFSWFNIFSKSNTLQKKQDQIGNKLCLDLSDDAAHANWGSPWRLPTKKELDELVAECIWESALLDKMRCYKVTSNRNGNCIFLPLSGLRMDNKIQSLDYVGHCWSSSLKTDETYTAYGINFGYSSTFESDMVGWSSESRSYGLPVRPVSD